MKTFRGVLFGALSISSLALAQLAIANDGPFIPPTTPAPAAAAPVNLKNVWPISTAPSHRVNETGVPNFGKLNSDIWRSGQPSKVGYEGLVKEGLKTVVNLREEFPQDKDLIPEGVRYVYIPIADDHAPTDAQAKEFIEVASNPANWPLLVHCAAGQGRAGVMSGLVRSSLDGWDHARVMKEVGNFRPKYMGFISVAMPACQQKFLRDWGNATGQTQQAQSSKDATTTGG